MNSKNLEELQNIFGDKDNELYDAIKNAFEKLYKNDMYLIEHEPPVEFQSKDDLLGKHYVGERAIVFRFAHYGSIYYNG